MKKVSSAEKRFLNEVWKKIHILSYEKQELELIKRNNIKYLKKNIRLISLLIIAPVLISLIIVLNFGFDQFTLILIGLLLLAMGTVYENSNDNIGDN